MEDGHLDVALLVEDQSDLEVVVPFGRHKDVFCVEVRDNDRFDEGHAKENGVIGHMQIVVFQQLIQINVGLTEYSNLRIFNMRLDEIHDEQSVSDLRGIEAVGICDPGVDEMSVANVGFVLVPTGTPQEIIAIDDLQLVQLVSALRVEAQPVEVHCSVAQHVFGTGRSVYQHGDVVDYLHVAYLGGIGPIGAPRKPFVAGEGSDVEVDPSPCLLAGRDCKDLQL